LTVWTFPHRHI